MSKQNRRDRQRKREERLKQQNQQLQNVPNPPQPTPHQLVSVHLDAHSGPLPRPARLREYDEIVPGAAERILRMGEKAQIHQHHMEGWEVAYSFVGLIFGLVIGLAGLGIGAYLGLHGQPWLAGTVITVTLGTLATAFVAARRVGKPEMEIKAVAGDTEDEE